MTSLNTVFLLLLVVAAITGPVFIVKGLGDLCRQHVVRGISYVVVGCLLSALAVLFLLPAYSGPPRNPDRRTRCMGNLSQIGKALKMASMDGGEENFPPSFLRLVSYINNPKVFVCPDSGHEAGTTNNLNDWTDYTYVSGLPETVPSECMLVFCPPDNHGGKGANVLFVDGSVAWVAASNFVAMTSTPSLFFGTTNEIVLTDLQKRAKIIRGTKPIRKMPKN